MALDTFPEKEACGAQISHWGLDESLLLPGRTGKVDYTVAGMLNTGITNLEEDDTNKRFRISELNTLARRDAMVCSAFQPATGYVSTAIGLLVMNFLAICYA